MEQPVASRDEIADRDALQLIFAITRALGHSRSTEEALNACLSELCIYTKSRLGEVWIPRADGKLTAEHIRAAPGVTDDTLRAFIAESQRLTFAPGTGLVGRVFLSREREWIEDVEQVAPQRYLRHHAACSAGLHAALGVPVVAGNEVLAVLVFYLDRARDEDRRRVELVTATAAQIGFLLRQRDADARIAELEEVALAVPVIAIWEGVALVPLVGALDHRRAQLMIETALDYLQVNHARVLIVDLTGLSDVDTAVVKALMDLAGAAQLLGAQTIFSGMAATTARSLVQLGVSLAKVVSSSSLADALRTGIELAQRPGNGRR